MIGRIKLKIYKIFSKVDVSISLVVSISIIIFLENAKRSLRFLIYKLYGFDLIFCKLITTIMDYIRKEVIY